MAKSKKKKKTSKSVKKAKTEIPKTETSLDTALKSTKKKKIEEPKTETSLDSDLKSAKNSQTDLQGLLKGVSEGKGYYRRKIKEENEIEPQLSYISKSKIVEEYLIEDVPISERKAPKKRNSTIDSKISITKGEIEKLKSLEEEQASSSETLKKAPAKEKSEDLNIYTNLENFFEEFLESRNEMYNRWEVSISNILAILRKMRKITKKNTEDLVTSINRLFNKIQINLNQFKTKRNEIEKISEVDLIALSGEFRKVLGMLELQIKEYSLKKETDELIRAYSH
ncbi:MAG: hypothetical protein ACFFAN_19820 [Promethearchaeota archaeon]